MLKLIIKFFPALIPLITYFIWILFLREIFLLKKTKNEALDKQKPKIINMEKQNNILGDPVFIVSALLSFTILVLMFIILAFGNIKNKGDSYTPAKYEDGKIIPAEINVEEKIEK